MEDIFKYTKAKDKVILSEKNEVGFSGVYDDRIKALISGLFKRLDMKCVVDYFRLTLDPFAAGEFFGKILRAACNIENYSKDKELKEIIDNAVLDIMSCQSPDGNISTTPVEKQPNGTHGSDLWERKYVLLGLWEYYVNYGDTCKEKGDVLNTMLSLARYTAKQVGEPPKTPITETGWAFFGIESSSILEPIMKLANLTNDPELLELADHIVSRGCCKRENMFLAIKNGKSPKDIGKVDDPKQSIAKAYEMMSCFEGLMEYYRHTGNKDYLDTVTKFINKVNEEEITYLGSGGADAPYNLGPGTGEQWNFTATEQANPDITLSMETCVTITYMKLMLQYYRLTGDPSCIDKIEVSFYNALLGAEREDGSFFDYFPKFNGTRSRKVNFSYDINGFPLSCCTANGPMGMAIIPKLAAVHNEDTLFVNMFIPGTINIKGYGNLSIETKYPENGLVKIKGTMEKGKHLAIRIPGFVDKCEISEKYTTENGYAVLTGFTSGEVTLNLSYKVVAHESPKSINKEAWGKVLFTYGPLVLSRDVGFDKDFDKPISGEVTDYKLIPSDNVNPFKIILNGGVFVAYREAGSSWDEKTEYRSWLTQI